MSKQENIIIIGNGIAGITAARHIRKRSNKEILVISAESDFFFSRTALMYIYMGQLKYEHTKPYENWFWEKNRIQLKRAFVSQVLPDANSIKLASGEVLTYSKLIIASGSKPNKLGWPGQSLTGVQGLYSLQDLEQMEQNTKGVQSAVVVGGGLIGIEMVEMLLSRQIKVTFLVRESSFWNNVLPAEESELISKHIKLHNVDLRLNSTLKEIVADADGVVKAIVTQENETLPCQFVGLTVGVSPNVAFLKESTIEVDKGVLVNEHLQTNYQNVYAIGDCAQLRNPMKQRKPIEAVWYTGKMMGETVAATICGTPTEYNPGIWFNSAKFFDIEYQTYGHVSPQENSQQQSLYWQATDGKRALRIVYNKLNNVVVGINALGVRLRHEVCDGWIRNQTRLEEVLANLEQANFDPEFYAKYEQEVRLLNTEK